MKKSVTIDYDEKNGKLITRQEIVCFLFALKNKIIQEDEVTESLEQSLQARPIKLDKNNLRNFISKKKEILKKFKEIPFAKFKNCPLEVLREAFCVKVFQDSYKNVITNLTTFNEAYQKGYLKGRGNFKKLGAAFNLLNSEEEILMAANLEDYSGVKELLYDAFKEMQEQTFSDIKKSLYTLEETDLDKKASEDLGVKVYRIGKQPKKMLMHVSSIEKKNMHSSSVDYFEPKGEKNVLSEYIALSYVDNENLKTFRNLDDYITVIYGNNIPQDHLVAISNKDAFVAYEWPGEEVKEKGEQKGVGTTVSHQKQMFLGAKELLNRTQTFNEVSILRRDAAPQNPTTRPIAVFCRREISDSDVSFAKQYGLPIVLSSANYNFKSQWTDKTRLDNTDYLEM